ncbi:MAG: OmpA family protein [Desulfuromonas sp.]|nr:OmpA family protein [Desulfuromonas sp.]
MKQKKSIHTWLTLFAMIIVLPIASGCVSKNAYQQQLDQSNSLRADLFETSRKLADLQIEQQNLQQQLAESLDQNNTLNQQNIEALAEIDRQANIYMARKQQTIEQISQLQQQQQTLQKEQQLQQQRYQELESNKEQLEQVSSEQSGEISSLQQELEHERIARQARLAKLSKTYNTLVASLEEEIQRGEVTISQLKGKLSVNLVEKILFASGSADLTSAGTKVIQQVGNVLKQVDDKNIRVEGHTDNLRISKSLQGKFPSNWELSAARAANVVRFLQREVGIAGTKLEIGAYGPFRPVADNASVEGRAQNRRIQIVLVPNT